MQKDKNDMDDLKDDVVISVKNLSKVYKLYSSPKDRLKEALHPGRKKYHKDFYALKDVNLEIRKGEVVGIVGRNGSGKSTLLKIISRVLTPTSGEVVVKGQVSSLLELGSGFNSELTGIENIFFYGTILGFPEEKIKSELQAILDFADIGDFVYQPLKTYSSGMKTRLAFAVAVNVDPDILILDEILSVGDELFRRKCYAKMEELFKKNKTVLYVSHSASTVSQLCTISLLLDQGSQLIYDKPKKVLAIYHKLIFGNQKNIKKIKEDIILNKEKEETSGKNSFVNSFEEKFQLIHDSLNKTNLYDELDCFIPDMIPKSRFEYNNKNVFIKDLKIINLFEEQVNVLTTSKEYKLYFNAEFAISGNDVAFGFSFKNTLGLNISGASSRFQNLEIEKVIPNESYDVFWNFKCNLLPGYYFIDIGITAIKDSNKLFLQRIIDALVFKVTPLENAKYSGFVFLNPKIEINKY